MPADRFFGAAPPVMRSLKSRVASNALELARHGVPKQPFYLTGQVGGQAFSMHAEGERVILTGADGRREIDLVPPAAPAEAASMPEPLCPQGTVVGEGFVAGAEEPPAPGTSPLDGAFGDGLPPEEGGPA